MGLIILEAVLPRQLIFCVLGMLLDVLVQVGVVHGQSGVGILGPVPVVTSCSRVI